MDNKRVRQYEIMFLFPPTGAPEASEAIDLARKVLEKHHCEILVLKKWDERKLAYEVARHKRGLYVIGFFKADTQVLAAIERDCKLNEKILRIMIVTAEHLTLAEMEAVEAPKHEERIERANDIPEAPKVL